MRWRMGKTMGSPQVAHGRPCGLMGVQWRAALMRGPWGAGETPSLPKWFFGKHPGPSWSHLSPWGPLGDRRGEFIADVVFTKATSFVIAGAAVQSLSPTGARSNSTPAANNSSKTWAANSLGT